MVMERIKGIPISHTDELKAAGVDLEKLAERGVNIFFTQVFRDNFFHADMHPGNIFVSEDNPSDPSYIAVDFGIVGSLTDEDRHYLSQNLLAFFEQDYYKVARLHVDSGWVPADTRIEEFESSIRTVCEPIFEKPQMEVQPQLVLLQKTLLNIEGLGRQLYPQLDLWKTARPVLKGFMIEQNSPLTVLREIQRNAPEWGRMLPEMPGLVHQFLASGANVAASSASVIHGSKHRSVQSDSQKPDMDGVIYAVCAAGFFICATLVALLGSSELVRLFGVPLWGWLIFIVAVWCLRRAFKSID